MKSRVVRLTISLAFLLVMAINGASAQTAEKSGWKFHSIVDEAFVRQSAVIPQPKGVVIIDSRPYKGKYVNGYIPTAINIPDIQFEEQKGKLPEDKNALLIFYCDGPT
jgi:hypothetical protein